MGVGSGLYMHDVVVKRSRSLSHLLMSSCVPFYYRSVEYNINVFVRLTPTS